MAKPKFTLILFSFIAFSCSDKHESGYVQSSIDSSSIHLVVNDTLSYKDAFRIATNFSKTFVPDSSSYEVSGTLENIPDSIVQAFRVLRHSDTLSHKRYLIVVFLKLYLDHLRCCHQSYEIRNPFTLYIDSVTNPMLYDFNLATKMFDLNKRHEFINSGIAHTYVEKHKDLLMYPDIREVLDKIKPVADSISKHLYWKN
jgi:hypothetical protein